MEFQSPGPNLSLGSFSIHLYFACTAIGFGSAAYAAVKLLKDWGYSLAVTIPGSISCFLGGLLGARIYYVLLCWQYFYLHSEQIISSWSQGRSIHGGVIGGIIAGALHCRVVKFPFLVACDIAGAVLGLGQAIGRWGNFFNSEAFGVPVDASFPLRLYIPISHRPDVYRDYNFFHPTFLYESVCDFVIFLFLYCFAVRKLRTYPGACFLVYVTLYSIVRLLIESIRTNRVMSHGVPAASIASGVSLTAALAGLVFVIYKHKIDSKRVSATEQADAG